MPIKRSLPERVERFYFQRYRKQGIPHEQAKEQSYARRDEVRALPQIHPLREYAVYMWDLIKFLESEVDRIKGERDDALQANKDQWAMGRRSAENQWKRTPEMSVDEDDVRVGGPFGA